MICGSERIHDAVVEPAGELRIVAEGVEPEADGSGGEDALPGIWASSHLAVLYSMVVRMSMGCSEAGARRGAWRTAMGRQARATAIASPRAVRRGIRATHGQARNTRASQKAMSISRW